jgi:hypothetical protein
MAEPREAVVHQAGDISLKGIGAGIGVIVGGIAIAVCVPWIVITLSHVPPNAPDDAAQPRIAPPVQRLAPTEDMRAFRREKMQRLEGSGVDPKTGAVHIPIERAMQLLVDRAKAGKKQ